MRPERADIAAPALPGRIRWSGAGPAPVMAELTATGPVLVHFFDFAQLNSVRALPYVRAWHERYAPHGLTVLGVHSPRFRFTAAREALDAGLGQLGLPYRVADDSGYAIWHDYGCRGWPSLFLWARSGALAWAHFGEGEYRATEEAIQELVRAEDLTAPLPEPLAPLRPTDAPGALVRPPSAEHFPGGSPAEPWQPAAASDAIEIEYEAGGAWVVADGEGELHLALDGGPARTVPVGPAALHPLAEHPRHERHRARIGCSPGARIWAVSFAPGMP